MFPVIVDILIHDYIDDPEEETSIRMLPGAMFLIH
jgi:hypothetical protein